ncbi:MAG: hypothetical protein AB7P49_21115, partial [Bdellovibrionales bacterium]
KSHLSVLLFVFAVFTGPFSFPVSAELFRGPISAALGGTGRAGLESLEAAFLNPALIPLLSDMQITGYYQDGYSAERAHRTAYGVGAVDNSEGVWIPGSLHYLQLHDWGRIPGRSDSELWQAALGKRFGEHLSFGISGYRLVSEFQGAPSATQWNFSLGSLWMIREQLGVAYVLDNVARPGSDVPAGLREDLNHALGVFWGVKGIIQVRMDIVRQERFNPDHKLAYMIGLESLSTEFFIIRLGFKRDELRDEKIWSAGFGFNGPRLRVDYAVQKYQEGDAGALHTVDLRVPF